MGLDEAAQMVGPALTAIGGLAMLGKQLLSGRPVAPAPASRSEALEEHDVRTDTSITVVVHVHLP